MLTKFKDDVSRKWEKFTQFSVINRHKNLIQHDFMFRQNFY
jgi:hypothetical protein